MRAVIRALIVFHGSDSRDDLRVFPSYLPIEKLEVPFTSKGDFFPTHKLDATVIQETQISLRSLGRRLVSLHFNQTMGHCVGCAHKRYLEVSAAEEPELTPSLPPAY